MNVAVDKQDGPGKRGHLSCHVARISTGWRLAPYPAYGPCGLPLIWPQNPGSADAYRGDSAVRFGSPEKA
ncbi:hypothetical protein CEG88_05950 [Klebsiella aerogenes]|nr:hypothetical protein CEG88_05950 [Klebsiella aerogenes]